MTSVVMYNKRNMGFLQDEIKDGKHEYLKEALEFLNKTEETNNKWDLNMAQHHLDYALPELFKNDESKWRRELLLNYFLNLELHIYKLKDDKHTKWTVFVDKVKENNWDVIKEFIDEIEVYMSGQREPKNVENTITQEKMNKLNKKYEKVVKPYIKKNLGYVDQHRAEHRLKQRLNLIKRKIPVNDKINFGEWIKEKRNAKGWSLQTLAEKSGYSPAYIFRIEKGTRKNPTPQVVSKIIAALGYEPETYLNLLFDSDEEGSKEKLKKVELNDLIRFNSYTVNGKELSDKQRKTLAEIFELINEDDVLQVPKINKLKQKIREYQK